MVVVGVVAIVPFAPGVISVRSGDVGRIGWACSWSEYDFAARLDRRRGVSERWVLGEIDDVEEPRESGVLAVIFVCMEKEFCDPCRVS